MPIGVIVIIEYGTFGGADKVRHGYFFLVYPMGSRCIVGPPEAVDAAQCAVEIFGEGCFCGEMHGCMVVGQ